MVDSLRPTVVYNCAAFHNVEVCESEEDRAFEVNARAVKRLATACADHGARFVHLSTNYVFDGTADRPYGEDELPSPRSIYAISKLAGEHAALAYAPGALVVRTAGLYGLHGSVSKGGNFVTRMIDRARDQGALKVVADQRLTPTFTVGSGSRDPGGRRGGRHGHVARDQLGCHQLARLHRGDHGPRRCVACPSSRSRTVRQPGAADRPLNGVLVSPASERAGLTPLRPWRTALADYLEQRRPARR